MPSQITVTACDNELIVLATNGNASFELCRILSGYDMKVNVTLNVQPGAYQGPITMVGFLQPLNVTIPQYLAAGTYTLLLLGVDWGVQAQFAVNVNGTPYNYKLTKTGQANLVFNPGPISITI